MEIGTKVKQFEWSHAVGLAIAGQVRPPKEEIPGDVWALADSLLRAIREKTEMVQIRKRKEWRPTGSNQLRPPSQQRDFKPKHGTFHDRNGGLDEEVWAQSLNSGRGGVMDLRIRIAHLKQRGLLSIECGKQNTEAVEVRHNFWTPVYQGSGHWRHSPVQEQRH